MAVAALTAEAAEGRPAAAGETPAATSENVVETHDLHVHFTTRLGTVRAVNGVSLLVPRGRVLGLVGESGCGKTITGLAIMQLVPPPGKIVRGSIVFRPKNGDPIDVLAHDRNSPQMRALRGAHVSMIFQEPMTALNPVYTVGDQIAEAILLHQTNNKREAETRAVEILQRVGMPNPKSLVRTYPHQLSGGMRQRAMIAMALSCEPDLLIADEPTTALDVTIQAQILDVMRDLQQEIGMSILFITHNLGGLPAAALEHVSHLAGCGRRARTHIRVFPTASGTRRSHHVARRQPP